MERLLDTVSIWRRFEWDSAHRIAGHEGACKAIHGHRYAAELELGGVEPDRLGRVIDFGVVKRVVGDWILANLDHTAIFDRRDADPRVGAVVALNAEMGKPAYFLDGPPTAERIVLELSRVLGPMLAELGVTLLSIRLWETPNCSAVWRRD
ncbi:MAG: 6-carboxytetrahydropterin synthase [Caulobacteraceae bacterium]|nr:6-carboxytetrahydropterin synthase [Caulobacteraceae bacterium]